MNIADVEAVLLRRAGKSMAFVGLDSTTSDEENADLIDPIAMALRLCSSSFSGLAATDSDLALLDDDDTDKFLDLAELRLLESILNNLDMVDIKVGPRSESLSQFGEKLEKAIARLEKKCQRDYGIGVGTLEAGVIALDFQQKDDEAE